MKKKMKFKRLARTMIMYWIGEAWHELDCGYYHKLPDGEKEMVRFYIHLYGIIIGMLLRHKYDPH